MNSYFFKGNDQADNSCSILLEGVLKEGNMVVSEDTPEQYSIFLGRGIPGGHLMDVEEKYMTSPKLAYSKCSGKPGWNSKYKKSGKSLCTLYPEKDGFVALIVILQDSLPMVEAMYPDFEKEVVDVITSAQPFNGTFWLMIPVKNSRALENVKDLLVLKYKPKKKVITPFTIYISDTY
ncbi:DUF3788 family protein [Candidatus Contubernalis alkaliaceticus]|uniref:DUF3788 family protein n=1 Tax=Candidatus Contubernalis alkaliaceticus TaxID=338645 RepID=UPI001F4C4364|nr:DUF3788 family protein [Candidatus Contubernalis alkalaceticus]UNC91251.1 DUF3788 family protein [Candidatus Contubernalis alkalaceticus]